MGYRHILKSFTFVNKIKLTSFRIDNGVGKLSTWTVIARL